MALISRMGKRVFGLGGSAVSTAARSRAGASAARGANSVTAAWDNLPGSLRGALAVGVGAAYIGNRFASGVSRTNEVSQGDFYDFVFGASDMDEQVFGRQMSPIGFLDPIDLGPRVGPLAGTIGGGLLGAGVGRLGFRRAGIGMMLGAAGGFAASLDPKERQRISLMMSPEMVNRHFVARKSGYYDEMDPSFGYPPVDTGRRNYQNRMPGINGSMVIGMYNSRGR